MSLQVVVGGMSPRPRVVDDGEVEVRDVLDLTVTIDHNVVDGAPAARLAPTSASSSRTRPRCTPCNDPRGFRSGDWGDRFVFPGTVYYFVGGDAQ